ncbi:MAG: DEAD/DEAH box helicase [Anaerolineales bacterium]|nr:DEAD/DEAH box helicase [Anaerolineales bacterium]
MKFSEFNLDSRLSKGIQRAGYTQPTPIQEQAIPVALEGYDIIGTAQTGTGKTAAFVLPILNKLLDGPRNQSRALIVTPTRELAEQIRETIVTLASGTSLRCVTVYGGVGSRPQIEALRRGAEIIVACPGRLLDLANQNAARLNRIEMLVLDEADRMFDMGFLPDVKRIIQLLPPKRQNMLFSATFPKEVEDLAKSLLHNPKRVAVGISAPANTVAHSLYPLPRHLKTQMLLEMLKRSDAESVLVFTRTKHRAQKVTRQLEREGFMATALHGNRTQSQRQSALKGFRDGRYQVMVATDIAARGLDIESIKLVVNYDMPDTTDAYIHRIGRTGRAQRTGEAFTLVVNEDDRDMLRALERVMGKIETRKLDGFDYSAKAAPEVVAANQPRVKPSAAPQGRRPSPAPQGRKPSPAPQNRPGRSRSARKHRENDQYAKRLASYK